MAGALAHWHQGAVVRASDHPALGLPINLSAGQRLVVTPYTCALAHATSGDQIDVLVLNPIERLNPQLEHGRSLKRLHLRMNEDGAARWFEATPQDRHLVDAGALIGLQPDVGVLIDNSQRDSLAYWLAARFIRSALPDKFNASYEPVRDKLRKALKRLHACRAILVAFNEQADGRFDAEFTLVLDPASDEIAELQQGAQEIEQLLSPCRGFARVAVSAQSADAVSLEDYWNSHHFDAFDDVSVGQDGHSGPANAPTL